MTVGADENNQQDAEDEGTAIARSSFCTKPFSGNHPEHGIVRSNVGLDSMFAEIERAEAREDGDLNYNRNQRRKHMGNSVSAIITETGPITVDADGKPVAEHLNTISAAENTYAGRPRSDIIPYGPPTYDEATNRGGSFEGPQLPGPYQGQLAITGPDPSHVSASESSLLGGRFGRADTVDENGHHYVGLVNQAMTCYLNSLIQTLYMTPEFRNAIYNWKFSGSDETKNIPFQLQKLFLLLQTSDKWSLETKDLTASFGWESNDAYDQHDVQELCRLMFDALEHRWKKTENKSLIQDLYKGSIEDYVKCLTCKREKVKPDVFLDLPLAVKQFGATESYKSVEEALRAFIKPEVLSGNNQYNCETCNSKQDAEKGLRITQFPYLLTIQLKRFDFDYNTLHRIKLNDKMTFPDILDINEFVHDPANQQPSAPPPKFSYASIAAKKQSATPPLPFEKEEEEEPKPGHSGDYDSEGKDECWPEISRDSEKVVNLIATKGKYVYELISIMVHQGNASGGHYFAYIKNVDQNRWYCFNDSSVTAASMNDIYRTFGGPAGGWYVSNTNAYMLIYRKIDPAANKSFIRTVDLPQHLIELKERLAMEEKDKIKRQRFEEDHIKVHYICNDETSILEEPKTTMIHKETSLSSVMITLTTNFDWLADENVRLIRCDSLWIMQQHLDNLDESLQDVLSTFEHSHHLKPDVYLMLDTKPSNFSFYPFPEKNGRTFEDYENLRLVIDRVHSYDDTVIFVDSETPDLAHIGSTLYGKIQLYIDVGPADLLAADREKEFRESKMFKIIDRKKFSLKMRIVLPSAAEYRRAGMVPRNLDPNFVPQAPSMAASEERFTTSTEVSNSNFTSVSAVLPLPPQYDSASQYPSTSAFMSGTESKDISQGMPAFSYSINDPNPPPPYSQSGMPCSDQGSPVSSTNIDDDDEQMDDISPSVSTPKRSPEVSEGSGDEDDGRQGMNREAMEMVQTKLMRLAESHPNETGIADRWNGELMEYKNRKPLEDLFGEQMGYVAAGMEKPPLTDKDSACETLLGGESTSDSTPSTSIYTIELVGLDSSSEAPVIDIEIDKRQPCSQLRSWLTQYLNLDMSNFEIIKHVMESDQGYSCHFSETDVVKEVFSHANHLAVKLTVSVKNNERPIMVSLFELQQPDHQKWKVLFQLPASEKTTVLEFLQKCRDLLARTYDEDYKVEQLRLRDFTDHGAVNTVSYAGPGVNDATDYLRRLIAKHEMLHFDRIEISEAYPTCDYMAKWPYTKSVLELYDTVKFRKDMHPPPSGYGGKLVYFKDSNEFTRNMSDEERKTIRIKESMVSSQSSNYGRRRERPLRIQMSSVSESDP
ncbi:ubiquitin carboxyl-terminal hydrolase domain-containing protein [Ditylenchus destructor]|uniref:Ubiquitin carboxyl-terminal hydrolase domain-containing protein n=1 Tax=Ditylenchus destructor TaxID=166010 RepID=A0AAD4N9M3_9BILA|nr:ubiquitin carboxyl-terminal hydrolase domain-containing protein [Ditylenchus destructor]